MALSKDLLPGTATELGFNTGLSFRERIEQEEGKDSLWPMHVSSQGSKTWNGSPFPLNTRELGSKSQSSGEMPVDAPSGPCLASLGSMQLVYYAASQQLAQAHLILLLEAIALSTFHLSYVLEEICHADGRVKLPSLVRHVGSLSLLVCVGLHQAAGVTGHCVGLV